MAVTDDVARLVRELWRLNLALGWQQRFGFDGSPGLLAKAAGATPETVQAWLSGAVMPSTAQALAMLDALPHPSTGPQVVAAQNGHQKAGAI